MASSSIQTINPNGTGKKAKLSAWALDAQRENKVLEIVNLIFITHYCYTEETTKNVKTLYFLYYFT